MSVMYQSRMDRSILNHLVCGALLDNATPFPECGNVCKAITDFKAIFEVII